MRKEEIKMENNNKAYVNLYNGENAPGLVGFATVMYNGLRISGIQIRLKKDGENTYVDFHTPSVKKMVNM